MYWDVLPKGGFNFDKVARNNLLTSKNLKHSFKKTGTTIVGVTFSDGVVLAADTRATGGSIVADPDCEKIHYLAPNIYACGAGTAADTQFVTDMMASELELKRLNNRVESRVSQVEARLTDHLFRYGGHIGAALIVGGVDVTGPHLILISPHGNSMHLPYGTMGSGSLAATGILETNYRDNMTEDEAKDLATRAIEAGIFYDLGSGSNVDLCVIKRGNTQMLPNVRVNHVKAQLATPENTFPIGTTPVVQTIDKIIVTEVSDRMDIG